MIRTLTVSLMLLLPIAAPPSLWAQDTKAAAKEADKEKAKEADKEKEKKEEEEKPVVTRHKVAIGNKTIEYQATAGFMPLLDADAKPEARMFYIAYTAVGVDDAARRPLMFSFNGGPGSSSVWLHLGALGPRRVVMPAEAEIPAPPFRLVENGESWLDKTDLVFIDPIETGYSRAMKPELNKKFHGLRGDIASVGEFIRMYLTRNERWTSPLYLVGESYGTTRAAGLAGRLAEHGVALNGVILISTVLDFQTLDFGRTNELPYVLFLPSYTATAWYHKKLPADLQRSELRDVLDEATRWATTEYRAALDKGDRLPAPERAQTLKQLARFTGLPESFLHRNNLRVFESRFAKELLINDRRTVGRFDSRYRGIIEDAGSVSVEFDPSYSAVRPSFTATFNQYVRADLGYKTDVPYHILGSERIGPWDWGTDGNGFPETGGALRDAMAQNPHLKVLVAAGYYDLATPFAAVESTLSHMKLDPTIRRNVRVTTYEAGHMMYVHGPSLAKLKQDAAQFIDDSSGR
jgi:carboxypeptidase C (cathepsin A)